MEAGRRTTERRVILASASPRRREILKNAGIDFEIATSNADETLDPSLEPRRLSRILSRRKAEAVAQKYMNAVIIAADTFIVFRGRLLGKPKDAPDARRMLRMLSGKTHSVITGYTILDTKSGKRVSASEETRVTFHRLPDEEIDWYIATGEPMDKAGAYGIQGKAAVFVRKIDGDYLNVVGLPLAALVRKLRRFGVRSAMTG